MLIFIRVVICLVAAVYLLFLICKYINKIPRKSGLLETEKNDEEPYLDSKVSPFSFNKGKDIILTENTIESNSTVDNYYKDIFLTSITDKTYILDTETTGLDEKSEIIEISIIDIQGNILLDTLIKPKNKIPTDATNIHGITNEMVKDAPSWGEIYKEFRAIVKSADIILIYNERYDKRLIMQTCRLAKVPTPTFPSDCIMKLMAKWNGEKKRNGDYMPKKLEFIAKARGVEIIGDLHRSLTDCMTVKGIIDSFIDK